MWFGGGRWSQPGIGERPAVTGGGGEEVTEAEGGPVV